MSHRSRASRSRGHVHCDSCFSRRCRARVEASVSCALIPCRLHCGALFHLCKEDDHLLLCPNVRVPCINAGYGCPLQLPRHSRAAHLQACPASVVSCSMEWLRWPTDDTDPHSDKALQDGVAREREEGREEALDLAMALVDQAELYSRLKMKPLYPELMEEEEEEEEEAKEEEKEESAVGGLMNGDGNEESSGKNRSVFPAGHHENMPSESKAAEETPQISARPSSTINVEKHQLFEMMFSMDKGGCTVAQERLDASKQPDEKERSRSERGSEEAARQEKAQLDTGDAKGEPGGPPPDTSKTGLAPWQEGVLERLREDLTPQEYNMYVVHHGRMLLAFGQIEACTPRDKDFVYGSLEPIPVQTLRSFKVPDSYHYRRRVHLYDTASRAQSEPRGVDTSDLGADEDEWFTDEAADTLLGYAEREVMGHKVSEPKAADGLYYDVGTQTHSFRSAPFGRKTTLAEVMEGRPPKLQLRLQAHSVNSRHNRGSSVFTFLCGHAFHRKEFATHFRNVHSDIQTCLSGWFEQRCPLAYLGCTYSQRRLQPSTHRATVVYNQELRSFNLRPITESWPSAGGGGGGGGGAEDSLSSLPYEVLCHMASFLDSLSLSQLALVSRLMRQVCWSLLQDRGMVTLLWERKTSSQGGARWTPKPVWQFSRLFSSVDSWLMADVPPISAHLKVCPFYEASAHSEPVLLPGIREKQQSSQESLSLVNHFTGKGWTQ
ncbi:F-box only protein 40-like [Salarias fasciatus]|uniref:F-box only protein 40-like n=1 Tax=Salarias fasciatus TaxID=181472 RepID=UPI00117682BD|nr:F-box only protein 40-like [Salarias fasciatus]